MENESERNLDDDGMGNEIFEDEEDEATRGEELLRFGASYIVRCE